MQSEPPVTLADILITPFLDQRVSPPRDITAEHEALVGLVGQAATEPSRLLSRLVDLAVELCHAGSAGVSLLEPSTEPGRGVFRWVALSGAYREFVGGTTPESFSPCGTCLSRGSPQLYRYPARLYTYLSEASPPIVEGLVLPLRSEAGPLGTIWIVSHDEARSFTQRDVGVMTSLADFTSTALSLQRARDDAEAANCAKDEFLAVVSHELRRPLTAIVGWSELLLAGRASPATAAKAIEGLHTNARRQQDMIEDLLDASRALSRTLRLNERPTDLTAVVRSAIDVVADDAQRRRIEIVADVAAPLTLHGDPERLHQIVANLLGNAVRFTPPGGSVSLTLHRSDPWIEILVKDSGIGITAQMLPHVFDAFCRADGASTRRASGLGLGLTIAQRLTALHGGRIEAQSEGAGRGALFIVRLPVTRLVSASDLPRSSTVLSSTVLTKRSLQLAGVSILIVDDEPDVRDILACVFEDAGASVVAAADVEGAVSALASHRIDVLVTDLVMPGQDGYDLLSRIEQDPSAEGSLTTVAVTALASPRERLRVLAAGFDHHVAKPVNFNALVELIVESARWKAAR